MIRLIILFFSVSVLAEVPRENLKGHFVLKNKKLYFTEAYSTTAPHYLVKWWNGKKPVPLCAINLNPACGSVEISFKRETIKNETILTNVIFTGEVKADLLRLKKKD